MRKCLLSLFLGFCLVFPSFAETVPGELIVKFKPGIVKLPKGMSVASMKVANIYAASIRALAIKYQVYEMEQLYKDALALRPDWKHLENDYLIKYSAEKGAEEAVKDYKKDPNVISASANTKVYAFDTTPNDTSFGLQWGLTKISMTKGWDRTTGSSESLVAVLDTGIDYNHDEFSGRVNLTKAKDYVNNDNDPMDDYGHGTTVSGVIGACANNSKGIAGIEWSAKILPIKVLNHRGEGSVSDINKGLAYVTALKSTGTNVVAINMSLGQAEADSNLETRCSEAYQQGIVVVAAAGNDNTSSKSYPAGYTASVIAVAATDDGDKRSVWNANQASNYGSWVSVSAPGSNIYTTDLNNSYSYNNGTSLAAPFVTGIAALLKACDTSLSNAQIVERITGTADDINSLNPGYENKLGKGRINAYMALLGLTAEITSPSSAESEKYIRGVKSIRGTAKGWKFSNYRLEAIGSTTITIETGTSAVDKGTLGTWDTTGLNGEYTLRLKTYSTDNFSATATLGVVADNLTPEVEIATPTTEATVAGKISISGKSKEQYLDRYVLEYGSGDSPSTFQNIGTYYTAVDNGVLGTWETAGLTGRYTLKLTAYDKAGGWASTSLPLSISSVEPTREAAPQPGLPLTFILPNPFDRSGTAEAAFVYNLQGNFNTTIYLFDLNGGLVWQRTYPAGENGGKSGQNTPTWNGTSLFGGNVSNGVYLYQITADHRVIARGKLIVLN